MTHSWGGAKQRKPFQAGTAEQVSHLGLRGVKPPGYPLNMGAPERLGKGESSSAPRATHACSDIECALAKVLLLPSGHRCCVGSIRKVGTGGDGSTCQGCTGGVGIFPSFPSPQPQDRELRGWDKLSFTPSHAKAGPCLTTLSTAPRSHGGAHLSLQPLHALLIPHSPSCQHPGVPPSTGVADGSRMGPLLMPTPPCPMLGAESKVPVTATRKGTEGTQDGRRQQPRGAHSRTGVTG